MVHNLKQSISPHLLRLRVNVNQHHMFCLNTGVAIGNQLLLSFNILAAYYQALSSLIAVKERGRERERLKES